MSAPVRLNLAPPIAEIAFARPERRNAFNTAMWAAIPALMDEASADRAIRAVIVHGGDGVHFAAGADISEFETAYGDPASARASAETVAAALIAIETCPVPAIAAIEGSCVGGGVSIALACDLRVAAEGARFAVTPARLGLVYPYDDTRRLVSALGAPAARDLLFTARMLDHDEAFRLRLVDRLCARGSALETARDIAAGIAALSPSAIAGMKRTIADLDAGAPTPQDRHDAFLKATESDDFSEGTRAFLEKRPPKFS